MTNKISYLAVNLKSPVSIFWIILSLLISAFGIFMIIIVPIIIIKFLFGLFALLFPFLLIYSITTKIVLKNNLIEKQSLFGSKIIKIDSVRSFGLYAQSGRVGIKINRDDIQKKRWMSQIFIYLSDNKDYNPNKLNQKNSLRFHYRKDLYEDLVKIFKITAST